MASLSSRIYLDPGFKIGPGKIQLLETIVETGSISGAGREMTMSYRRAWELVEAMTTAFQGPVVERQVGGKNGGGATLTPFGAALVKSYGAIEASSAAIAKIHLDHMQAETATASPLDKA